MTIIENDRLDLRQELERLFSNKRLADIAMEAMPPIDYANLATKRDLDAFSAELRGEMSELGSGLRVEMTELRGDSKSDIAELGSGLRVEMSELGSGLRVEMAELRGDFKSDMATNLRLTIAGQLTTMMMLGAWVAAIT